MVKCRMPLVLMVSFADTAGIASAASVMGGLRVGCPKPRALPKNVTRAWSLQPEWPMRKLSPITRDGRRTVPAGETNHAFEILGSGMFDCRGRSPGRLQVGRRTKRARRHRQLQHRRSLLRRRRQGL